MRCGKSRPGVGEHPVAALTVADLRGWRKPAPLFLVACGQSATARCIIDQHGDPWWVLVDVCRVLEINNSSNVAVRLDDDEKSTLDTMEGAGGPDRTIISEPGLYKLLMTSRKQVAKR